MYDFTFLKPISKVVDIIGRVIASLSIIVGVLIMLTGEPINILIGIGVLFGGSIIGILFILNAQLVNLFLQIEENTRKQL